MRRALTGSKDRCGGSVLRRTRHRERPAQKAWSSGHKDGLGRNSPEPSPLSAIQQAEEAHMNGIIYLVGLIVIIMFILSLFGLR